MADNANGLPDMREATNGLVILEPRRKPTCSLEKLEFVKTSATTIKFTYPLKVLIPDHAGCTNCAWIYPITYGGGLVSGDEISLEVQVKPFCAALITTQASTKVYHSEDNKPCVQRFKYSVADKSLLCVLPDPIVCYKEAIYKQSQRIELSPLGNLVLLDWLTAGRTARGEIWQFTKYDSCNEIVIDGRLRFKDSVSLEETDNLSIAEAVGGFQAIALCVLLGPQLETFTENLLRTIGRSKSFGEAYISNTIVSISPLSYDTREDVVKGCIIRIGANTTTEAFAEIEEVLSPLYSILGGDPFENKY
ncbi:unnamed protein product [Owenia fusiformis]|uniref:Uncharacterized protein n=1 Tax=Owenia fusiformis TaxID=6347 RepID=A0A8J1XNV9_OWEFU|nr:unnamed protein product [Owenia fusiformis]